MKNCSVAYRASAVSAVSKFYEKNDSPLFGRVKFGPKSRRELTSDIPHSSTENDSVILKDGLHFTVRGVGMGRLTYGAVAKGVSREKLFEWYTDFSPEDVTTEHG